MCVCVCVCVCVSVCACVCVCVPDGQKKNKTGPELFTLTPPKTVKKCSKLHHYKVLFMTLHVSFF